MATSDDERGWTTIMREYYQPEQVPSFQLALHIVADGDDDYLAGTFAVLRAEYYDEPWHDRQGVARSSLCDTSWIYLDRDAATALTRQLMGVLEHAAD